MVRGKRFVTNAPSFLHFEIHRLKDFVDALLLFKGRMMLIELEMFLYGLLWARIHVDICVTFFLSAVSAIPNVLQAAFTAAFSSRHH